MLESGGGAGDPLGLVGKGPFWEFQVSRDLIRSENSTYYGEKNSP